MFVFVFSSYQKQTNEQNKQTNKQTRWQTNDWTVGHEWNKSYLREVSVFAKMSDKGILKGDEYDIGWDRDWDSGWDYD